ncbi:MAG: hypothetical protein EOO65_02170 [Methanosarcinales archaeon]|nr:MAG: hypothetical protein EOO65_02170 [Methanosarcinales archaeon]
MIVAVDYTGSNGDPRSPSSLHYFNPSAPNEYLQAITACSSVLLEYDSDKMVPAYGFGGAIGGTTNHCFAMNFNEAAPEVPGIDGLVGAYRNSFQYVGLSGPTYFAPLIKKVSEIASQGVSQAQQRYTVLLLITDGQSNDLDATVRSIVDASVLPLSIVIVGVGGADFSAMEFLDGDGGRLAIDGRTAARDIVQFVPFRKFASFGTGAGSMLAKEVLAEVPGQLTSFMMARGIVPKPAPAVSDVYIPAPGAVPGAPAAPVAGAPPASGAGGGVYGGGGAPAHSAVYGGGAPAASAYYGAPPAGAPPAGYPGAPPPAGYPGAPPPAGYPGAPPPAGYRGPPPMVAYATTPSAPPASYAGGPPAGYPAAPPTGYPGPPASYPGGPPVGASSYPGAGYPPPTGPPVMAHPGAAGSAAMYNASSRVVTRAV